MIFTRASKEESSTPYTRTPSNEVIPTHSMHEITLNTFSNPFIKINEQIRRRTISLILHYSINFPSSDILISLR